MQPYICSSLAPQVPSLEELIQKAKRFVASAKSPATLKAYRNDWHDFESWTRLHNLPSLPKCRWPNRFKKPANRAPVSRV
jgi:hypothetical protein